MKDNSKKYINNPSPEEMPSGEPQEYPGHTSRPHEGTAPMGSGERMDGELMDFEEDDAFENNTIETWEARVNRVEQDFQRSLQEADNDPIWTRAWDSMKDKAAEAKRQLSQAKAQVPTAWEKMKAGIREAVEDLERGYKKAKADFDNRPSTAR